MNSKTVLITGGAGFIGSHLSDQLISCGFRVIIYDKLVDQVHESGVAEYVPIEAELIIGDMQDKDKLKEALVGVDYVINLAAEVGVGQSMYKISRYVNANTAGTAVLLELLSSMENKVSKLIVASSMSVYGEGMYSCKIHGKVEPRARTEEQLKSHVWEILCPLCQKPASPIPTTEEKELKPSSIYAITKLDQELMSINVGEAYGISTIALRFFNVYGTRQSLSNPYTGVGAIFSSRLLNGYSPMIFEDGDQARDFIHVSDVVQAIILAMENDDVSGEVLNIGTGNPVKILEIARRLARELETDIQPEVTNKYRVGDIRNCWADTTKAERLIGFKAKITFQEGIKELIEWVREQQAEDRNVGATTELESHGLTIG